MLTIAIPTYNRSQHLDRQLQWLAAALRGHEESVEVLVSDNASTDGTTAVVDSWRTAFEDVDFTYRRNPANIGAVPNMASCIRFASRRHVWVISDDDVLGNRALQAVLSRLKEWPDLGLLTLNFSSRYAWGTLRFARSYPIDEDRHDPGGIDLAGDCLYFDDAGLGLISAQVFRTDLARQALGVWPSEENLLVPIFWAAYCARKGGMVLTADTFLECTAGSHFWTKDPLMHLRMNLADAPELCERLLGLGYNPGACHRLVVKQLTPRRLPVLATAIRLDSRTGIRVLVTYLLALRRTGLKWIFHFAVRRVRKRLRHRRRAAEASADRGPMTSLAD